MARVVAVRVNAPSRKNEIRKRAFISKVSKTIRWVVMEDAVVRGQDGQRQSTGTTEVRSVESELLKGLYNAFATSNLQNARRRN